MNLSLQRHAAAAAIIGAGLLSVPRHAYAQG
jgi:hypothetical protein